ncbi:uncharacterized protein LOC142003370 isoform X2 [Carettochelys insculpta]|uniref:uncharacterized protein LOC142003370 isoform X2 n=1 Tax=Carettochelys insculpta TaxID=44489 RepID=UPI003EBAC1FA
MAQPRLLVALAAALAGAAQGSFEVRISPRTATVEYGGSVWINCSTTCQDRDAPIGLEIPLTKGLGWTGPGWIAIHIVNISEWESNPQCYVNCNTTQKLVKGTISVYRSSTSGSRGAGAGGAGAAPCIGAGPDPHPDVPGLGCGARQTPHREPAPGEPDPAHGDLPQPHWGRTRQRHSDPRDNPPAMGPQAAGHLPHGPGPDSAQAPHPEQLRCGRAPGLLPAQDGRLRLPPEQDLGEGDQANLLRGAGEPHADGGVREAWGCLPRRGAAAGQLGGCWDLQLHGLERVRHRQPGSDGPCGRSHLVVVEVGAGGCGRSRPCSWCRLPGLCLVLPHLQGRFLLAQTQGDRQSS